MNENGFCSITTRQPWEAFKICTEKTIAAGRLYSVTINCEFSSSNSAMDLKLDYVFDRAFSWRKGWKQNRKIPWRQWLEESGFPMVLYEQNNEDLMATLMDKRLYDGGSPRAKSSAHNFFGQMARPREALGGKGFMQYTIDRWRGRGRSMPHYYFDVENPEWVWAELVRNGKQVKTGRSASSCCMNMYFRWHSAKQMPIIGWLVKHCDWSHLYNDIYSPINIGRAICKELGIAQAGFISTFFASISMDFPKEAKQILGGMDEGKAIGRLQRS